MQGLALWLVVAEPSKESVTQDKGIYTSFDAFRSAASAIHPDAHVAEDLMRIAVPAR